MPLTAVLALTSSGATRLHFPAECLAASGAMVVRRARLRAHSTHVEEAAARLAGAFSPCCSQRLRRAAGLLLGA